MLTNSPHDESDRRSESRAFRWASMIRLRGYRTVGDFMAIVNILLSETVFLVDFPWYNSHR